MEFTLYLSFPRDIIVALVFVCSELRVNCLPQVSCTDKATDAAVEPWSALLFVQLHFGEIKSKLVHLRMHEVCTH